MNPALCLWRLLYMIFLEIWCFQSNMPKEKCFQSNLCQSNLCSFLLEAIQTTADKEKSTPLPTSMWEDPWGGLVPGMAQHGKIHFLVTKMTLLQFRSIQPPPEIWELRSYHIWRVADVMILEMTLRDRRETCRWDYKHVKDISARRRREGMGNVLEGTLLSFLESRGKGREK